MLILAIFGVFWSFLWLSGYSAGFFFGHFMVLGGILVILVIWEYVGHSRDFKVIFLSNFLYTKNRIYTAKPLK